MVYSQGQENFVGEEGRQTPTDKYKVILMDTLKKAIELDTNGEDEKFIRCVDQLHNLMRLYAVHREGHVKKYEDKIKELQDELKSIDDDKEKKGYNQIQKDEQKLRARYRYAKECLAIIIDMMNNSPLIEKEIEGLFYSPTTLQDYTKIRERILQVQVR